MSRNQTSAEHREVFYRAGRELFESGSDTTTSLEPADAAFASVALAVGRSVERRGSLAAIRIDRVMSHACRGPQRPMTGVVFRQYVQQMLAVTLRPGDIALMDNLASHKVGGVREALQVAGAEPWHLPPYSPDLNPMQRMWSKVNTLIKTTTARRHTTLYDATGHALQTLASSVLTHYHVAAGCAIDERTML